jgi:hypothetical protein
VAKKDRAVGVSSRIETLVARQTISPVMVVAMMVWVPAM